MDEAQRGQLTCPKSHSNSGLDLGFDPSPTNMDISAEPTVSGARLRWTSDCPACPLPSSPAPCGLLSLGLALTCGI